MKVSNLLLEYLTIFSSVYSSLIPRKPSYYRNEFLEGSHRILVKSFIIKGCWSYNLQFLGTTNSLVSSKVSYSKISKWQTEFYDFDGGLKKTRNI